MKPIIMTSSGLRAIVGENFDPSLALKMTKAFGTYLGQGPVIVGGDTRTSHEIYKNIAIAGLLATGLDVIYIGKVPTPTCQQMIKHHNAMGSVVITASHNPIMWNGIKLMNKTGSFLDDQEYSEFEKIFNEEKFNLVDWSKVGELIIDKHALEKHVDKILSIIDPSSIKDSGLKVLMDPNNGTGCLANPILMDRLGIEYEIMNSEGNGRFDHNPEPVRENLSGIMEKMKSGNYDVGFVQDADADRLVVLAEDGRFIGEDYSLALSIDYILQHDKSPIKQVAVNLSTSSIIENLCKKYGAEIHYTKIGETNVTQRMKEIQATVGGEGNGGVMYPKVGWGRDSLVGILIVLKYLAESKKKVSEIVSTYPQMVMLRDKITVSNREEVANMLAKAEARFPKNKTNKLDGVKIFLDKGWIHMRPSNTEPIVRIFIEAENMDKAKELMEFVKK